MTQLEGMWIGNCHILRRIGGGGMGDVYLAEQPALGRNVAIKVAPTQEWEGAGKNDRERADAQLAQEARAIAALDHPNILPLYEFGEHDRLRYLVMPYVERGSMADLLRQSAPWGWTAPLAPALVASIIEQTAGALQFAHDRQVIHRDVKPGNLLVRLLRQSSAAHDMSATAQSASQATPEPDDVHILLADFGLARSLTDAQPNSVIRGTPLYSAPEQLDGRPGAASDQYALACVAYYLLTGHPIFTGSIAEICHQHINVPPVPPTSLNPTLPASVDAVLLRGLAKRPEDRYPGVVAFAQGLRAALSESGQLPQPPTAWNAPAPRRESALSRPARVNQPVAAMPATPLVSTLTEAMALADAPTQADGIPGDIDRARDQARGRRPKPRSESKARDQSGPASDSVSAKSLDGRRPDGPAGQLPLARRRGKLRSLLATTTASRPPLSAPGRGSNEAPEDGAKRGSAPTPRVGLIGLAALVVLSALGGAGWIWTHRSPEEANAQPLTSFGSVSLASAAGATVAPLAAPPAMGPAWQRSEPAPAPAAHYAGLPSLDAPMSGSTTPAQVMATGTGAQGAASEGHPWQTSVGSDGQTTVVVSDDTITVFRLSSSHTLDVAGVAGARTLFAHAVGAGDALDQPRIVFDSVSRRWMLVMRQVSSSPSSTSGALDIAVSETDDPLGSWRIYQLSTDFPSAACAVGDDPRVGANAVSLTVTANLYTCGAHRTFLGVRLWDFSRGSLLSKNRPEVYAFGGFKNTANKPVFSVVPAVQRDDDTTEWLVSDDASYADGAHASNSLIVWALEHPNGATGAPTLVAGLVTQVPLAYADPPAVAAPGVTPLGIGDARPTYVGVQSGRLYVTFSTATRWTGDTLARAAVYWAVVALPPAKAGKQPTESQLRAVQVSDSGVWGEQGASYIAPVAAAASDGALTVAAVRVVSDQVPRLVMATRQPSATTAVFGPPMTIAPDSAPLVWGGQGGASLGAALTSAAENQGTTQNNAMWLVSVTASGGARWQVQLWLTQPR